MDKEERKMLAITARMEGNAAIVANIGEKVSVSEMELICLVNFAEVGVMSVFASLDGEAGDEAGKELDKTIEAIRTEFGREDGDGLTRLSATHEAGSQGAHRIAHRRPERL